MDDRDQSIFVSGDVEHDEFPDLIGTSEELSQICKSLPTCTFHGLDPVP